MSLSSLDCLFAPESIVLVGAGGRQGSLDGLLARNLAHKLASDRVLDQEGSAYGGPIWAIHPKKRKIGGLRCLPDLADLPGRPDLAIIASPAVEVPRLLDRLGALGSRAAIITSAGFGEGGDPAGLALREDIVRISRRHGMRLLGPNCLGLVATATALNASLAHRAPPAGRIAFVAQSGTLVTSVLDWALARGIGFSHLVSLGDMVDLDFGDILDHLALDGHASAILLFIETLGPARKFLSAARAAARLKPVILVKAGRFPESARAVLSHAGALAGTDAVHDAAFRRAGLLRVHSLEELFDAVANLAQARPPRGDRLAILTNSGGAGVLATDALIDSGGRLAELSPATLAALNQALPCPWSHANPIDILGDADSGRYARALTILRGDPGLDAVLALHCPFAGINSAAIARALIAADTGSEGGPARAPTLMASWIGGVKVQGARRLLAASHLPSYDTPERAIRAFMHLVAYRHAQVQLMETPPALPEDCRPDLGRIRPLLLRAQDDGREWLTEPEAKAVLSACGIPVVATLVAQTPDQAATLAREIGGPVALKLLSPDIPHKRRAGGVALELTGPQAVRAAALAMLERIRQTLPEARIDGFSVQEMVRRPEACELILGLSEDPQFGPVLLVGQGGSGAEALRDTALGLPPLNLRLAAEMLEGTRIHARLRGGAGLPRADLDAITLALVRLSQLIVEVPEILELDVNPLLADRHGILALDARIRLRAGAPPGVERLAILPYPRDLEEEIPLPDGRHLWLRPIQPEDEPALQEHFGRLEPEEVRMRFFVPRRTLDHITAARFSQIDYDREMALVLTEHGIAGRAPIHGVVSLIAGPGLDSAEFAIVLNRPMTGLGLGILLMRRILDHARGRGLGEVHGEVLRENRSMLKLCKVLGFTQGPIPEEPGLVRVSLRLDRD